MIACGKRLIGQSLHLDDEFLRTNEVLFNGASEYDRCVQERT